MIKRSFFVLGFFCLSTTFVSGQSVDLSHWKITIPEPRTDGSGKPIEVSPPEIKDFENNDVLKPYFYRDQDDGAVVFRANPASTTTNTKYSRSELREQMEPGSNKVNWTFPDGGIMRGTLSVPEVSKNKEGDYHRVIIMQIHGRLTNEQRDLIGEDDNNAPPMLKIYWDEGKVRVKTKVLKDPKAADEELLHEHAWGNDKGKNFKEIVGHNKFTLEVNVSKGKMEIILNDDETFVYEGKDIDRWGIFENYFKAGNYFQSRDKGSYSIVKYYDLQISHGNDQAIDRSYGQSLSSSEGATITPGPIDLSHWRLELPTGYKASDWKLSKFQDDDYVKPFFYLDTDDQGLVMEAYPSKGTSKAKYTRSTLREQMQAGSSNVNWTMKEGGVLEANFEVSKMSKDASGKYHKTLLFQVDGRTSAKQTKKLGLEKPMGVPLLKVFWQNEKLYVKRKVLKDETMVGDGLLMKKSWKEADGIYSREKIGFGECRIRLELKKGKIIVQINDEKPITFRDVHVEQWYFENYFTAGNYLQSKDEGAHAVVKFHELKVTHDL